MSEQRRCTPVLKQAALNELLAQVKPVRCRGQITSVCGSVLRAVVNGAAVGDRVYVRQGWGKQSSAVPAQVVGFDPCGTVLSPLVSMPNVMPGAEIELHQAKSPFFAGRFMLGTVVDSLGRVVYRHRASPGDGGKKSVSLALGAPCPLERLAIVRPFPTGVRAIDGLLTVGLGQRLAIFAEPGVGKSTLVTMMSRFSAADVNVIALIGERGREITEFAAEALTEETAHNTIIIASSSAEQPLARINAALAATAVAEFFRDQGLNVLLQIDSLTRLLRAYRELGLAAGELPVRRGYPPSAFSEIPRLIERAGRTEDGSITAFYTVLLSSDLDEDPMVDEIKGLTDGHITLSKAVAQHGRYPAIDILASISRLSGKLLTGELRTAAQTVRAALADIEDKKQLLSYADNRSAELEQLLEREGMIERFLRQDSTAAATFDSTLDKLNGLSATLQ